jgi:hypothetical protein
MTPYERLMAEALPTGTFGHARPATRRNAQPSPAWTPEQQAAHRAELDAALDGFELDDEYANHKRDRYREQRAHLRLITNPPARQQPDAA